MSKYYVDFGDEEKKSKEGKFFYKRNKKELRPGKDA